jgi:hypothetical protein
LLLVSLLQAIYGTRSERILVLLLDYNMLFPSFVGLYPDDPVWHPTSFTNNRDRLLLEELMGQYFDPGHVQGVALAAHATRWAVFEESLGIAAPGAVAAALLLLEEPGCHSAARF